MSTLLCTIDETPASAALVAALLAQVSRPEHEGERPELVLAGPQPALRRLAQACARRGLSVELDADGIKVAGRALALRSKAARGSIGVRLREHRVELEREGSTRLGERAELLAAAPLLEAIERGTGLRWALLSVLEGADGFASRGDLGERKPDAALDAGLQRCFPSLVGRIGFGAALGPQPGAALHLSVLLGAGATIDGVRDLLAAQAETRSRWPRLRMRPGFGSADCLGDPGVHLDLDALTSAGPLLRLVAYYDPPAVLAGDLLRRLADSGS
ncbi:MAG: hypothetical protein R6X02_24515 [Enhygromyxa sp.]